MAFDRNQLVGHWYRQEYDEFGLQMVEHCRFTIDGQFEFCFMTLNKLGDVTEQVIEHGDWGLVGDIHFTITHVEEIENEQYPADMTHPDNYHAYKVLTLNANTFQYQHIESQECFILKRVIDNIGNC